MSKTMTENDAMNTAQLKANATGKAMYVRPHGKGFTVSTQPGTMCCTRVVPAI